MFPNIGLIQGIDLVYNGSLSKGSFAFPLPLIFRKTYKYSYLSLMIVYGLTELLCPVVSTLYPMYASVKAIDSGSREDHIQWIIFWAVQSICAMVTCAFPYYVELKLLLSLWLVGLGGSEYLFHAFLHPHFLHYEQDIDAGLVQLGEKASALARDSAKTLVQRSMASMVFQPQSSKDWVSLLGYKMLHVLTLAKESGTTLVHKETKDSGTALLHQEDMQQDEDTNMPNIDTQQPSPSKQYLSMAISTLGTSVDSILDRSRTYEEKEDSSHSSSGSVEETRAVEKVRPTNRHEHLLLNQFRLLMKRGLAIDSDGVRGILRLEGETLSIVNQSKKENMRGGSVAEIVQVVPVKDENNLTLLMKWKDKTPWQVKVASKAIRNLVVEGFRLYLEKMNSNNDSVEETEETKKTKSSNILRRSVRRPFTTSSSSVPRFKSSTRIGWQ